MPDVHARQLLEVAVIMGSVNDCKYNALSAVFGSGQINDLLLKFLQANGATSGDINDAWSEVFGGGVTPPPENAIAYYDFTQFSPTSAITDKIGGEVVTTTRGSNLNVLQSDDSTIEIFAANQAGFDRGVGMLVETNSENFIENSVLESTSNTPNNWLSQVDQGTRTVQESQYNSVFKAINMTVSTERNVLRQDVLVAPNEVYTASIAVSNVSGTIEAEQVLTSLAVPVDTVLTYPVCEANPSGGNTGIITNGYLELEIATGANSGTAQFRFGLGCIGNVTGSAVLEQPQFEDSPTRTSFIATSAVQVARPTTEATIPTDGWPTTDFRLTLEFIYLGENGVNARLLESVSPSNERILLERTSSGDQYIFIRKDVEQSAVGPLLPHNIGDVVKVVIDCSSAGTTVTVNDIAGSTNTSFNTTPFADYPLRLFQSIFGDNLSTRALAETISIQSPIPAPPSTSILQVESVVGGTDPKEVAYGNIGLPSDPQGSLVPPLLLDGEPFSLVTQLINPFGKLILLVNESQNWTVGRTVVASFDGVQYTFLPDVLGGGQDFNITICQSQQLYDELYDKRDTDIDFSILSVTQAATPTLGTSATGDAFNDGLYAFYKSQGATGEQLNDLEQDFWCNVAQPQNAPLPWILSDNSGNVLSDNSGTALRT